MNMFLAQVEVEPDGVVLHAGTQQLAIRRDVLAERADVRALAGREVIVGVRPEQLSLGGSETSDAVVLRGSVELCEALGSDLLVHVAIDAAQQQEGNEAELLNGPGRSRRGSILVARLAADAGARDGDEIALAVSARKLHLFDPDTSAAIWN
jgi:multiple sugar transport system ATP-binding protein